MIDQIIVLFYLAISLIIGIISGRNTVNIEDYAVGKRNFSNFALAAGITATMISASGTSGLTGKIYIFGLISIISYLGVVVSRILVVYLVAPKMINFMNAISSGDIFEKLYGKNAKILIGLLTIIEGSLLAGAQVLATYQAMQIFFNISKEMAAISTTMVIILYCFRGGIRSVNATDIFQFIIIMVAIPVIATFSIDKIGGIQKFISILNEKHLLLDSIINGDKIKHLTIFVSIAITCVFPLTIQRMLMAKNIKQIKKAFFINSFITLFFYLTLGLIGLSSIILLPNIDPNLALPAIIDKILPVGIRGMVIAGLIAIFMSSADSDMNITAIALTQDLLKPLLGNKLTERLAFSMTRISFVFTGIFAIIVALYFSNALDILFVLMTLANSIYFPGMFFGIIGVKPTKLGFWIGALSGAVIAASMSLLFHVFPLYAMMIAITANSSVILCSHFLSLFFKNSPQIKLKTWQQNIRSKNTFFEFKKSNYLVSTSSYCDIFAIIVLINSIAPFFLKMVYLNNQSVLTISINLIVSIFSVLLLLRQTFKYPYNKLVPIIWQITVFLSLTMTIAIFIRQYQVNLIIIFDLIFMISLLMLLLEKYEFVFHVLLFILSIMILSLFGDNIISTNTTTQYWSAFLHAIALILCLILFRQREVAAYKFMSHKFVHEAGRTISSVSTSTTLLKQWLPILIENYRLHRPDINCLDDKNIQLNKLLEIPDKLSSTSNRTWENLKQMISWMDIQKQQEQFLIHSIKKSLQTALDDNSLPEWLKEKITINDSPDFFFYGDNMQISNVIINLLENASHAIKEKPESYINICTEKNCLIIKDYGIGISKAVIPNIFDDFFSTKGTSGQGLAFCKLVMQQHNGDITCESELGKHTTFKLLFPQLPKNKELLS